MTATVSCDRFVEVFGARRGSDRPPTTAEARTVRVAELIKSDDDSVVYPLAEIPTGMHWRLRFALIVGERLFEPRWRGRVIAIQQMSADADADKWPWEGYDWVQPDDETDLTRMCGRAAAQLAPFSDVAPTASALLALLDSSLGLS